MTEALAVGGTSFDASTVNVNGQSGYFIPVADRLRAGGPALSALRHGDSP